MERGYQTNRYQPNRNQTNRYQPNNYQPNSYQRNRYQQNGYQPKSYRGWLFYTNNYDYVTELGIRHLPDYVAPYILSTTSLPEILSGVIVFNREIDILQVRSISKYLKWTPIYHSIDNCIQQEKRTCREILIERGSHLSKWIPRDMDTFAQENSGGYEDRIDDEEDDRNLRAEPEISRGRERKRTKRRERRGRKREAIRRAKMMESAICSEY